MARTHHKISLVLGTGLTLLLVCMFVGHAIAQPCVQPPDGLVSWWPGDGTADDIQNGNDGTLHNGATFAAGIVGEAFSFDGVNDYVEITNAANLNFGTGSFSIDFWINYPTAVQTATVVVHGASSSVTPSEAG